MRRTPPLGVAPMRARSMRDAQRRAPFMLAVAIGESLTMILLPGRISMLVSISRVASIAALGALLAFNAIAAKQTVKIAFIGPLTGGVSANGIGGRKSAPPAG